MTLLKYIFNIQPILKL